MEDIESALRLVQNADPQDIQRLCHEVMARYRLLFPDSEIMFLSLPKNDPVERSRLVELLAVWLRNDQNSA